ncbi:hypothetical protein CR513_44527, partial [Mucuna pruriens]
MTRSSYDPLHELDPEIEITLCKLRKARNIVASNSSNSVSSNPVTNNFDSFECSRAGHVGCGVPTLVHLVSIIESSSQTYELKSDLIYLLPKFHGLAGEDPHKHLKEFHVVCSTMRPQGILEDYIKMKAFSFSLDEAAKDWLYLQPVLFNTLEDMKRRFLEKFFPASRTATIRKEICGIRQHSGETLHEYWERFNKLCVTCPHHQISEQLLIKYFYEGLAMMDRSMIDTASGGALMDKTPTTARHLISNMASNTQQFGIRGVGQSRMVNEIGAIDNLRLENQLTELTSLVRQLVVGKHQPSIAAKVCDICTFVEHPTDMCPMLAESRAICSSTIWTYPRCTSRSSQLSIVESAISSNTFPTTTTTESASSRPLAISRGPDEAASNKQSRVPTKYEIQQHAILAKYERHHSRPQNANRTVSQYYEPFTIAPQQELRSTDIDSELDDDSQIPQQDRSVPLSFPTRTLSAKKLESDEEFLKMFRKVEINIPLLDIPKYAKFLKELCVHKRKKMKAGVESGGIVSALTRNNEFTAGVQQAPPKKCRDPKIFFYPMHYWRLYLCQCHVGPGSLN